MFVYFVKLKYLENLQYAMPVMQGGMSSYLRVVVVLRSPIHANEPSEYNGMLYRTSNRVLNNGIKVIILICMDGTSQYHHYLSEWQSWQSHKSEYNLILWIKVI